MIFFRVDSSPLIGSGHVYRCLALAEEFIKRHQEVFFVMTECIESHKELIRGKGVRLYLIEIDEKIELSQYELIKEDARLTIRSFGNKIPDWVIVDHYELSIEWERAVRSFSSRIMVIDDFPSKSHICDVFLNQNSDNLNVEYRDLLPESTKMLLGPRYALINENFFLSSTHHVDQNKGFLERLLVFFTGGDDMGETLKALHGIDEFDKNLYVDVVIGAANKDYKQITNLCKKRKWVLHSDIDYMPTLMSQADLIIGSCGSSSWERCLLKKGSLVSSMAENQKIVADTLNRAEAIFYLGQSNTLTQADYKEGLASIDAKLLRKIESNAGRLVDGYGKKRVADLLLS